MIGPGVMYRVVLIDYAVVMGAAVTNRLVFIDWAVVMGVVVMKHVVLIDHTVVTRYTCIRPSYRILFSAGTNYET